MSELRVRFYAGFRPIIGGKEAQVSVDGDTLGDLLEAIVARWPATRELLFEPDGSLSKRANLFVDGRALRFLPDGAATKLEAGQALDVFEAVAGG